MSVLLDELTALRRKQALSYQEYLEQIRDLAKRVQKPSEATAFEYPMSIDSTAKKALYDNFGKDEVLTTKIDTTVRHTKKADWLGDRFKEREIALAIHEETAGYDLNVDEVMTLVKAQKEYH